MQPAQWLRPFAVVAAAVLMATIVDVAPRQEMPSVEATSPGTLGKIAFTGAIDRAANDLYTVNPDGTGLERLTNQTPPSGSLDVEDPAWSPDGTKIAVWMNADGTSSIWTMDADGGNPTRLGLDGRHPSWSPDGSHLVFQAGWTDPGSGQEWLNLFIAGTNGTGLTQLTIGDHNDVNPTWSPTAGRIAFARDGQLAMIDSSGENFFAPTTGVTEVIAPSWSPDGTKLVFSYLGGTATIHSDGTGFTKLTELPLTNQPTWSPDGNLLVYMTQGIEVADPTGMCRGLVFETTSGGLEKPVWQPLASGALRVKTNVDCESVMRGSKASFAVSLLRSGMADPVSLAVGTLPQGMSATFSPSSTTGSTSTLTITTTECPDGTPFPAGGVFTVPITASGGGQTATSWVDLKILDGPPRITQPPASSLYAPSTVGTGVGVRTKWLGCDGNSLGYYMWGRQASGGVWEQSSCCTLTTAVSQTLTFSKTYRYRAQAFDSENLASSIAYGPTLEPLLTQQTSSSLVWHGTWSTSSASGYSGGTTRWAKTAGAYASYTFTGSSIGWVTATGSTRGSAKVYLDGVLQGTVDLHGSSSTDRRLMFAYNWPKQGKHTIKIVVVGTAGHPRVDVDGFVRLWRP